MYFTALLLLIEFQLVRLVGYRLRRWWSPRVAYVDANEMGSEAEDGDVRAERRRISATPLDNLFSTDSVVISNLTRTYRGNRDTVVAVDRLSFGVRRGECFGLLGINGAGKTTTFQMLTGDILPTSGDAYINGLSITRDIRQVVTPVVLSLFICIKVSAEYYSLFSLEITGYASSSCSVRVF